MLYSAIPQTQQVTVSKEHGPSYTFTSEPLNPRWSYSIPFGGTMVQNDGRASGDAIPPNGAAKIVNLLTCAAVTYIYTDNTGNVLNVALYHAHTGMIPKDALPTAAKYNLNNVPAAQIYVVFASSQEMNLATPTSGIQTAADGLIDLQQKANIPTANIRVITGTGSRMGANSEGEIGMIAEYYWAGGNLENTLNTAANDALNDYKAQFSGSQTKLGLFGSTHNKTTGINRINALTQSISAANNDSARLTALQSFLNAGYSFKDGSLKLYLVRQLSAAFRPLHLSAITPANAKVQSTAIISGIQNGTY